MPFIDPSELKVTERRKGWKGRTFDSGSMSFAHFAFEAGAWIHEHCHPNEEVWNVIEGQLEVTIGGDVLVAGPGFVAVVPPNTAHSARAITNGRAIVVDSPLRLDADNSQRSVLAIDFDSGVELPLNPSGAPIPIPFTIRNWGQTSALVKRISIESKVAPVIPPPTTTQIPLGELPTDRVIQAGESYTATIEHLRFAEQQPEQIRNGSAVFYVMGVILYEDTPGSRYHTTFCRTYDPDALNGTGGFVHPRKPGYNYGS